MLPLSTTDGWNSRATTLLRAENLYCPPTEQVAPPDMSRNDVTFSRRMGLDVTSPERHTHEVAQLTLR